MSHPHVTVSDIARQAGVSATTVSLSFQSGSRISDTTRQRVLAVAEQLGYTPNHAAQSLRQGASWTVGVLVPDLTDTYYASLIRASEALLVAQGYSIISAEGVWDPQKELQAIEKMAQLRVDGLLICSTETTPDSYAQLARHGIPHIALNTYPKGYVGDYAVFDFPDAGRQAAEHLLGQGCRHPLFVNASGVRSRVSSLQGILSGYRAAFAAAGLPMTARQVIEAGDDIAAGRNCARQLLEQKASFDGIFCISDYLALGMMEGLDAGGIRVGEQVALMGIDDVPVSALERFSLTSITLDAQALAGRAVGGLLANLARKRRKPEQHRLRSVLVERRSSRLRRPA